MKLLDLGELPKSDFVIFSVLVLNNKIIGLTMIDKILVNSIEDSIMRNLTRYIVENPIIILDFTIECPENDEKCIQKARQMGIEPNKEIQVPLGLVAISSRFLNVDRFRELLEKNVGEIYQSLMMSYCTEDELDQELMEYLYYISSIIISEDDARLFKGSNIHSIGNRAIVVDENGKITIRSIAVK